MTYIDDLLSGLPKRTMGDWFFEKWIDLKFYVKYVEGRIYDWLEWIQIKPDKLPNTCVLIKYDPILRYEDLTHDDKEKGNLRSEGEFPPRYIRYMDAERNLADAIEEGNRKRIKSAAKEVFDACKDISVSHWENVASDRELILRMLYLTKTYKLPRECRRYIKWDMKSYAILNDPMVIAVGNAMLETYFNRKEGLQTNNSSI